MGVIVEGWMIEAEWLACTNAEAMYEFLYPFPERRAPWTERKERLLGCACVRRVADILTPDELWCLNGIELYADGQATELTFDHARDLLLKSDATDYLRMQAVHSLMHLTERYLSRPLQALDNVARGLTFRRGHEPGFRDRFDEYFAEEMAVNADLVREVALNPFRSVAFSPQWRTDAVLALAGQGYEARDFSAMPILADALQDAGCEDADILDHCRGPGPHVRGCWVVDLVLGKE
jgi:hypothetical protein